MLTYLGDSNANVSLEIESSVRCAAIHFEHFREEHEGTRRARAMEDIGRQ